MLLQLHRFFLIVTALLLLGIVVTCELIIEVLDRWRERVEAKFDLLSPPTQRLNVRKAKR